MPLVFNTLALALATSVVIAGPVKDRAANFGRPAVLEQVAVPSGWDVVGTPNPKTELVVQIGLKQGNVSGLEAELLDIANPRSANYGQWLSKEQLEEFTAPSKDTLEAVQSWLVSSGVPSSSISRPVPDWIHVTMPIVKVEQLLDARYQTFRDGDNNQTTVRTTQYSVPSLLHSHIDTIQPTTAFLRDSARSRATKPLNLSPDSHGVVDDDDSTSDCPYITGPCLRKYYNVDYVGQGKASMGIGGALGYSASHSDMAKYMSYLGPEFQDADFLEASIAGQKNDPSKPEDETNFDLQIAVSTVHPNNVTFYTVGPAGTPNQFNDELLNIGQYLGSATNPPDTFSLSFSGEEQGFDPKYLTRACNEFLKAGARGVSLFFSTGDNGVNGRKNRSNCTTTGFYTVFPATCPYVTAVGGTQVSGNDEVAVVLDEGGSSGGGFSTVFKTPRYQRCDVQRYISKTLGKSLTGYYNPKGRAYPDVSLLSYNYLEATNGSFYLFSGTSCSTPAFASLVSLLNDYRISKGKPTLGFLNPLLYSVRGKARGALRDITSGSNPGCGTSGFTAAPGWDPVTGLGSMDFAKLRKALD